MWICDTKAYGNGMQNIKYTYALLYVVEGRPHEVDTCTSNTCRRGCNPQPLEWNCEWETFNTPSSPTLEPVTPKNTKSTPQRNQKAVATKAIPNLRCVVQPMSAYQNHHHIDLSYENRCTTCKHHRASSHVLFSFLYHTRSQTICELWGCDRAWKQNNNSNETLEWCTWRVVRKCYLRISLWKKFINTPKGWGWGLKGSCSTTMSKWTQSLSPRGPLPVQGLTLQSLVMGNHRYLPPPPQVCSSMYMWVFWEHHQRGHSRWDPPLSQRRSPW